MIFKLHGHWPGECLQSFLKIHESSPLTYDTSQLNPVCLTELSRRLSFGSSDAALLPEKKLTWVARRMIER